MNHAMFSTTPRIGTFTVWNMRIAFFTSSTDTSCGVVTMIGAHQVRLLAERQLRVAGARRQVDDQVVDVLPGDVEQELSHGGVQHRAAPDHRLVLGDEQRHRDHLQAVRLERHDALVLDGAVRRLTPSISGTLGP